GPRRPARGARVRAQGPRRVRRAARARARVAARRRGARGLGSRLHRRRDGASRGRGEDAPHDVIAARPRRVPIASSGDRAVGLELGTSSVKGVVDDERGAILLEAERPLALEAPEALAAEQDPEAWWRQSVAVLRELAPAHEGRVRALGLTGQKHAFLP